MEHYKIFGHQTPPVWPEGGKETWCMIGNHAIPVMVDAWTVKIEMLEKAERVGVVALVVPREIAGFVQQNVRLAGYHTPGKSSTANPATGFDQRSRSYLMGAGLDIK